MNPLQPMLCAWALLGCMMISVESHAVIDGNLRLQNPRCKFNCTPQPVYPANISNQAQSVYVTQYPYPVQRAQIALVTPNVQIYVQPQAQYHYQQTEEVVLPYGGTYRKTTEYLPQYPVTLQNMPQNRQVILKKGIYQVEP